MLTFDIKVDCSPEKLENIIPRWQNTTGVNEISNAFHYFRRRIFQDFILFSFVGLVWWKFLCVYSFIKILLIASFENYFSISILRCFINPIRVSRIENRVPRIRENHHRVPISRENRVLWNRDRVTTCPYRVPHIFLKKTDISVIVHAKQ